MEEKKRSLEAVQAGHELQIKQFRMELQEESDKLANVQIKLQGTFIHLEDLLDTRNITHCQTKENHLWLFFFLFLIVRGAQAK